MPPSPEAKISPCDVVRSGMCIGCGGCTALDERAAMRWDRDGFRKPEGPTDWFARPSAEVARRCPFSPSARNEDAISAERFPDAPEVDGRLGRLEGCYVGHVAEEPWRKAGSSGGMVSWVAAELLQTGRVDAVAHVAPADARRQKRFFAYGFSWDAESLLRGSKSRYYPVDLADVLRAIRNTPGRYAIVGVPCFIKAVHLARRADPVLAKRITHTLGLFCGHQKSAHLVDSFAWQLGTETRHVEALDYRIKDPNRPANWYRAHLQLMDGSVRAQDWWHLADGDWGAGFFQNPACNWCDDVAAETADIAFGDAWVEPYSSDGRGTNVVVTRSPELQRMLEEAIAAGRLALKRVHANFVADTQAAGFRHRREGLAYRLTWRKRGLRPVKRVAPGRGALPLRRRLVYRTRAWIMRWSHRMFRAASLTGRPRLYTGWARPSLRFYQALTWSQGRLGSWFDRIERVVR